MGKSTEITSLTSISMLKVKKKLDQFYATTKLSGGTKRALSIVCLKDMNASSS